MITLLNNIKPVYIDTLNYTPSVIVEWLHGGKRVASTQEQRRTSTGPSSVVQTAIFTIGQNEILWEDAQW